MTLALIIDQAVAADALPTIIYMSYNDIVTSVQLHSSVHLGLHYIKRDKKNTCIRVCPDTGIKI